MEEIVQDLAEAIDVFLKIEQQNIDWDFKIREEKWSNKEIIGHLIDSAQIIFSDLYGALTNRILNWYMPRTNG
jgi:hypothetical protein